MTDLEKAKELLEKGNYTCAVVKGDSVYLSFERGVKPIVSLIHSGAELETFSAADKVVGRATAFLYAKLKINALYAKVLSRSALEVLQKYGIDTEYENLVDNIINRKRDGICPFEEAVMHIDSIDMAYLTILDKMNDLKITL